MFIPINWTNRILKTGGIGCPLLFLGGVVGGTLWFTIVCRGQLADLWCPPGMFVFGLAYRTNTKRRFYPTTFINSRVILSIHTQSIPYTCSLYLILFIAVDNKIKPIWCIVEEQNSQQALGRINYNIQCIKNLFLNLNYATLCLKQPIIYQRNVIWITFLNIYRVS